MFWIVSLLLMVLAVLFVLVPVIRSAKRQDATASSGQHHRDSANLMIFQERLAELESELTAGNLEPEQYQALKAELERTLLADMGHTQLPSDQQEANNREGRFKAAMLLQPARLVPLVFVLVMLPLSYFLYSLWGFEDDLEIAEVFERSRDNQGDPEELRDLIFELGAIIEEDRENGWAWYFLARHLISLGQMQEAVRAFELAAQYIDNPQDKAVVLGQYAQASYIAADQQMTAEVEAIIEQAQRLNPAEPTVLQLLGAHAFVNEEYQAATTYWQQLLSMSPGAEDRQFLNQMINEAQQRLAAAGLAPEAATGPSIEISLALSPQLVVPSGARVFVSARNPAAGGPPLAAKVLTVAELPTVVTLSNADAVGPQNLASADQVQVVATVSLTGSADVQSGDFQVRSEPLVLTNADEPVRLQMQIAEPVR